VEGDGFYLTCFSVFNFHGLLFLWTNLHKILRATVLLSIEDGWNCNSIPFPLHEVGYYSLLVTLG
jgi:hypothetical protein